MLKVGLVGLGFMGRAHLKNYVRLQEEGFPIQVTAICDTDSRKFQGYFTEGNMQVASTEFDFSGYAQYTDYSRMLQEEELDFVDIALPTFLHKSTAIAALRRGLHVMCEKPMALNTQEGREMIEAAEQAGKKLMIAQCLRFWPEYEYLKETVESGRYGKVLAASFFRGGNPPKWTHEDWMVLEDKSGGGMMDLHIHDIDMVNWLFGKPESVTTLARHVLPGSAYDIISTNYKYPDHKVVNCQVDRVLHGDFGFEMSFRVNFEGGNLVFEKRGLKDYPKDGKGFSPELSADTGYYREIRYFAEAVMNDTPIEKSAPEDTWVSLQIAEAEKLSAESDGASVSVA
ncbi:Gfo/Idh/MocA family protein [Paenibacillus sp. HJGM_3]|uniref:Gfo/Idh/MocA family protein n=1 Tax=Paenibacillus sp. HJGM_3 TaxID=3379816 RepID=UPI00385B7468